VEPLEPRQLLAADLISVATTGDAGNEVSASASVTPDGRFVAFASRATNLVAGVEDTNDLLDVFLRDRATGVTTLVSRSVGGARTGNASSGGDGSVPSVSADGRFVAFQSKATDLVEGVNDTFNTQDVFVRDMQTGATTMLSVSGNGNDTGGERPVISADGRFVAFHSGSFLLVPNIPRTNSSGQVFVRDLQTGGTAMASVGLEGDRAGNGPSAFASISGDGRYVAFASEATNLAAADTAPGLDVFVRDLREGTTTLVSVNRDGAGGNNVSQAPAISADGRFVAFESAASDLVVGHSGTRFDVFVRNLAGKTTTLASADLQGDQPATGESRRPSISPDGRLVAFSSTSAGLTADPSDIDQYLRDTAQNLTYAAQLNPTGSAQDVGLTTSVTADGRVAVGVLGNPVAADKNAFADVYLVDVVPASVDLAGPTATLPAAQPARPGGGKTLDFDVAYADATGVKVDTIGDGDVRVTLPDGSSTVARLVKTTGTGTSVTATYRIDAAGGSFGPEDNGTYTVALLGGAVADTAGNTALPAPAVGAFAVALAGGTPGAGVDLVPTVTLVAPPAVTAGTGAGKVTVRVDNDGATAVNDTVRVVLYLSTDATLDAGDATLLTFDKRLRIKGNGFKNVKANVVFPSGLPQAGYVVIASLDEPNSVAETDDFNNVAASSASVVIAEPFVDLTGSFPKHPPLNVSRGGTLPLSLVIQNAGNIARGGNVVITVALSANGQLESTDTVLTTVSKRINFKPGASKAIRLKLKMPTSVSHGTYRIVASLDTLGTIPETDTANNTAATNAFQIS
jgi:Tol biopolymer transport system component